MNVKTPCSIVKHNINKPVLLGGNCPHNANKSKKSYVITFDIWESLNYELLSAGFSLSFAGWYHEKEGEIGSIERIEVERLSKSGTQENRRMIKGKKKN